MIGVVISSMEMRDWPGLAWHVTNQITSGISKSDADRSPRIGLAVGGKSGGFCILFMICVAVLQQIITQQINPRVSISILIISDMFMSIFLYWQHNLLLNIKILWKTFYLLAIALMNHKFYLLKTYKSQGGDFCQVQPPSWYK